MNALFVHRFQFAFTIVYHYLFPQLTMGLALLIVALKIFAVRRQSEVARDLVRFLAKILGVAFAFGVVTGIPLEFQFGTNWARFSERTGAVVGQALAMEGMLAFFLESAFLYFVIAGERRLGDRGHLAACGLLLLGTWSSGFFVVATNAWMQHPVAYATENGRFVLTSLGGLFRNPWFGWQYLHTMTGAVVTGSFFAAGVGAYYLLRDGDRSGDEHARLLLRTGVVFGLLSSLAAAFPTGDQQAKLVWRHQPITFAAMEGHFHTEHGAALAMIGQPNMETLTLDNPVRLPRLLSLLTHARWSSEIRGLSTFDRGRWPDNVPLLYYAYHIMVGLGTLFLGLMGLAAWSLRRGRLYKRRWLLWPLMLAVPFPFIANSFGWMTAELGRQPWLVYGLLRTRDGTSQTISVGNGVFTLLGFMGLYALLSLLCFFIMVRIVGRGPAPVSGVSDSEGHA